MTFCFLDLKETMSQTALVGHKYVSALCLDAFNFITVSTQTSTNISLLLLKEHTKTFSQTTLERSLTWTTDIHARESFQR